MKPLGASLCFAYGGGPSLGPLSRLPGGGAPRSERAGAEPGGESMALGWPHAFNTARCFANLPALRPHAASGRR